jgi:hypothetical protein
MIPVRALSLSLLSIALYGLFTSVVGDGAPPADKMPADKLLRNPQAICGALCATIESVTRGSVEIAASESNGTDSVKYTYSVTFDDGNGWLRSDYVGPSGNSQYIRTPTGTIFCQERRHQSRVIELGPPDRDLTSYAQPLDPHILWYTGPGSFIVRGSYAKAKETWLRTPPTTTKGEPGGYITLTWILSGGPKDIETIHRLVVDPGFDFVPRSNEVAIRLLPGKREVKSTSSAFQWEKQPEAVLPIAIDMIGPGDHKISLTCRWVGVNKPVDPDLFTVAGLKPGPGTRLVDWNGSKPVLKEIVRPGIPVASGGAPRASWGRVFIIANFCVLVLLSLALVMRWRGSQKRGL